jgi:hypothetical protein
MLLAPVCSISFHTVDEGICNALSMIGGAGRGIG